MDMGKSKQSINLMQHLPQILKISFLGIVVLSAIFAINQFRLSHYFPIKTVRVYGVNRLDRQELQAMLQPLVNRGFFNVNMDNIRDQLLQMPWVSNIFVRRNWPDQLEITVIEKNAVASWNGSTLLSENGELFSAQSKTYPNNLPKFVGPQGKQIVMLQYFTEMNRLLMPLHVRISNLELTSYFSWKLTLDNGITLQVGHEDILTRLGRFVKVYPKIIGKRYADVDYIDLRYANGMAVQWKTDITKV